MSEDVQRDAPARSQDHGGARRKADYIALTKAARARSDTLAAESIDLQRVTIFSAGLAVGAKESDAGKAFIACLTAPEAAPMITKSGLEPVTTR